MLYQTLLPLWGGVWGRDYGGSSPKAHGRHRVRMLREIQFQEEVPVPTGPKLHVCALLSEDFCTVCIASYIVI